MWSRCGDWDRQPPPAELAPVVWTVDGAANSLGHLDPLITGLSAEQQWLARNAATATSLDELARRFENRYGHGYKALLMSSKLSLNWVNCWVLPAGALLRECAGG